MRHHRRKLRGGDIEIETVQESPWSRTLTKLLPQRVLWRIESEDIGWAVTADFRTFPWFNAFVLGLFFCGLTLPVGCVWSLGQPWIDAVAGLRWVVGVVALLAPLMVVAVPTLLGALGGGRIAMSVWQPVAERVERDGGTLEPAGSGVSRRYVASLAIVTLALVGAASPLIWTGLKDLDWYQPVTLAAVALLTALEAITLLGAWWLARRRGVGLRAESVLIGVVTSASILFLLLPVLFFGWAGYDATALENIQRSGEAAGWGARVLVFVGVLISAGIFLTANGVRASIPGWLVLTRLYRNRDRGVYRLAVEGGPVLGVARRIFVIVWAVSALFIVGGLSLVGLIALRTAGWLFITPETTVADILAAALALVLGHPWNDPVLAALARILFLLYSFGLGTLFAVSVGHLWWARRGKRRLLLAAMPRDFPKHRRLQRIVRDLCEMAGVDRLHLAIVNERIITACSHTFGFLGQERFLEISEGALRHLTEEELRALIAHELVHHLRGNVQAHNRVRWLGRLTFVGDGFVRALLDSFGYEVEADRAAVLELGVRAEALLYCLWKIQNVNPFVHRKDGTIPKGFFAALERSLETGVNWRNLLSEELSQMSWTARWRLAWRLFLRQYFVLMDLHYWHPGPEDREAALRLLMETQAHA